MYIRFFKCIIHDLLSREGFFTVGVLEVRRHTEPFLLFAWIFKQSSSDIDKPNGLFVPITKTQSCKFDGRTGGTKLETINLFNLRARTTTVLS